MAKKNDAKKGNAKPIRMVPVESSNLRSIGYDEDSKVLAVQFKSGTVYIYHGVPSSKAHGLMNAPSHGQYFDAFIKEVYTFDKLEKSELPVRLRMGKIGQ